jgi:hypothetical protein
MALRVLGLTGAVVTFTAVVPALPEGELEEVLLRNG